MNKTFRNIIKEICDELNIKYKILSKDWIIMLEKDGVKRFISGFKFDLNDHALGIILDDKYATYELLRECNIPIIEHNIVFDSSNKNNYAIGCNSFEYLEKLFFKYNEDVVLKINCGTCGTEVLHLKNIDELRDKFNELSSKYYSLSLCPFYNIENEYRAVVLNGKVELLYKKNKALVVGNGKSTIKELLCNFNPSYFANYEGNNKDLILEDGKQYEYDWRFNLSNGAKASFDIMEDDREKITKLAEKISKEINVNFGSIDIIKTVDGSFYTMEINSGIMTNNFIKQIDNGYEIAKDIYKKAIKLYFS